MASTAAPALCQGLEPTEAAIASPALKCSGRTASLRGIHPQRGGFAEGRTPLSPLLMALPPPSETILVFSAGSKRCSQVVLAAKAGPVASSPSAHRGSPRPFLAPLHFSDFSH